MGSGNLHNKCRRHRAPVPRISSSDADKSLHASGVKARRRASNTLAAGRAASLLSRGPRVSEHHGPLAQLVRAHG